MGIILVAIKNRGLGRASHSKDEIACRKPMEVRELVASRATSIYVNSLVNNNNKCFVYSGNALSYPKLVYRHSTQKLVRN